MTNREYNYFSLGMLKYVLFTTTNTHLVVNYGCKLLS